MDYLILRETEEKAIECAIAQVLLNQNLIFPKCGSGKKWSEIR